MIFCFLLDFRASKPDNSIGFCGFGQKAEKERGYASLPHQLRLFCQEGIGAHRMHREMLAIFRKKKEMKSEILFLIIGLTFAHVTKAANYQTVILVDPYELRKSYCYGISGSQQAGYGYGRATGNKWHALLWEDTVDSIIDLHPALHYVSRQRTFRYSTGRLW